MRYLKIMALCLVAVFALSAVASASAAELELVNKEGKALIKNKLKGESGKGALETKSGNKITCTKTKFEGKINNTKKGEVTMSLTGCESLGFNCNTVGSKTGEIKTVLSLGLVFGGEAGVLLLFTILPLSSATVTIECTALQKYITRHGFVAEVIGLKLNKLTKILETHPESCRVMDFKENSSNELVQEILLESEGKLGFEDFCLNTEATKIEFEEEAKVIEN